MKALKYSEMKDILSEMLQTNSIQEVEQSLGMMISKHPSDSLKYKKVFFSLIKDIDLPLAIQYGEDIMKEENNPKFMQVLAVRYKRIGQEEKYNALVNNKIPISILKIKLDEFIQDSIPFNEIKIYLDNFLNQYSNLELLIYKIAFSKLKDVYTKEAIQYGEEVIKREQDLKFIKVLVARYKKIGDFNENPILNNFW